MKEQSSAIHAERFLFYGNEVSYRIKKAAAATSYLITAACNNLLSFYSFFAKSFKYSPTERLISFEKSELYLRLQNAFI